MIFTLYWRTGHKETVEGEDIAKAMTLAGYSNGAVRALDFYANGVDEDYKWNPCTRQWEKITPFPIQTLVDEIKLGH